MKEPVHPGFTIMPVMDQRFKDGVTYGTAAERKRIINMLKKLQKQELYAHTLEGDCNASFIEKIVILIKGENK